MSVLPRASVVVLASSAFQTTMPTMQAVMTSAKMMTTALSVIRRNGPPELE